MLPEEAAKKDVAQIEILSESETERLRRDIFRPDMEKFYLFTKMLRMNAIYKKAKITHK